MDDDPGDYAEERRQLTEKADLGHLCYQKHPQEPHDGQPQCSLKIRIVDVIPAREDSNPQKADGTE